MEDKKFEEYFSKVDDKFEELNSRMSSLQDVVLRMKSGFDILARSRVQEDIQEDIFNDSYYNYIAQTSNSIPH